MSRGVYQLYVNPYCTAWHERLRKESESELEFSGLRHTAKTGWYSYDDLFRQSTPSRQLKPHSKSGKVSRSASTPLLTAGAAAFRADGGIVSTGSRPGTSRSQLGNRSPVTSERVQSFTPAQNS
eukprot:TRINITY_DN79018_c0_g1_i1.p1 TRINITY_DN79018_c0_g1~~TRINITY_DN79018_c0_g1_i1.p1  ORF type:complete len:124 (+),score=5.23 TRINITY_DN79018_c0_g1_i1:61-432(+)